ncbi:MAG: bifunctional folylpolyglutamate synthase/dihydrofolate synthase [Deltaproteobacteria bacterium]|nr:MAG: bifunctional folylpolyglutamate synthase/dihydrofolate synthase [Deltaproteobacteria bacterium]
MTSAARTGGLRRDATARYRAVLDRLYRARRAGVRFDLDRVRALLERLGAPQAKVGRIARIGGTNGKGSAVAFAEAIARASGLRTGAFTSPHLSRFAERFRIDGAPAADDAVADAAERVFAAAGDRYTFFELATAIALCAFADAGVDVALLEVGMGGRLDATNAVSADVSAVTGVALDHQAYLGTTLAAIAREKAGIFEPGRPAIVGRCGEPAGEPLLEIAARQAGARLIRAPASTPGDWPLGLAGAHQRANAAVAVEVVRALAAPDAAAIRAGLAAARWPGRLERIADDPPVVVDGAHNPHAARAIAGEVAYDVLVLGAARDKDIAGIAAPLVARARAVVCTEAGPADRAAPAAQVAAAAARAGAAPVEVEPDPRRAVDRARARAHTGVLVAGSLFVVGAVRRHLLDEPADPIDCAERM